MASVREKGNALNRDIAKSFLIGPPANQKSAAAATAVRRRQLTCRAASTTGVSPWLMLLALFNLRRRQNHSTLVFNLKVH